MPRKLSETKIEMIKELRRQGLSINEISKRLQAAPATVFYYARDEVIEKKLTMKLAESLKSQTGKGKKAPVFEILHLGDPDVESGEDAWGAFVRLPFTIICPGCGEELKKLGFLFRDGSFHDALFCGAVIDIRTAPRKEELSLT